MVLAVSPKVSFDEFVAGYPENSEHRYELHEGVIVEMPKPRGKHSEIAGFLNGSLFVEITRLKLPYFLPRECIVKSVDDESGYEPDVIVLDRAAIAQEPRQHQLARRLPHQAAGLRSTGHWGILGGRLFGFGRAVAHRLSQATYILGVYLGGR
jgi:Uma2 family endonuclease